MIGTAPPCSLPWSGSPTSAPTVLAALCFPDKMQGLISLVLSLVRDRGSFLSLMTTRTTLSSATSVDELGGERRMTSLPCPCHTIRVSDGDSSPMLAHTYLY